MVGQLRGVKKNKHRFVFRGSSKHIRIDARPSTPPALHPYAPPPRHATAALLSPCATGKHVFHHRHARATSGKSHSNPAPPTPVPLSVTPRLQASCFPALLREAENKLNKNGKTNKKRRLVYSMNHSSGVTGAFGEVISLDSISSARAKPPPARFFLAAIDSDSKMKHLRRLDQAAP